MAKASVAAGTARGKGAAKAKRTKGRKAKGRRSRSKKKGKLKCGESGTYSKLQNKYADGKERDHIPSCGALLENAKKFNGGRKLCNPQKIAAIKRAAQACAIPKGVHALYSETFKWKNDPATIKTDAADKPAAAKRNTDAIKAGLKKSGKQCQRDYNKWAKEITGRDKKWYDNMISKAMNKGK